MNWIKWTALAILLAIGWTAFIFYSTIAGWWRTPIAPEGNTDAFLAAVLEIVERESPGNLALVLVENGEIAGEYYGSTGKQVDRDTQFQVASLSKWLTATAIMKLVQAGKVDLDAPVSRYLTRWQLPESDFDNEAVTPRLLLSHTSGLTDGLGFAGYDPAVSLPTIEEALANPNGSPGRNVKVAVGVAPGSEWQYSGGGYLILQLLIEEVSGQVFEAYMQENILQPLGMTRSTFIYPDIPLNMAASYDTDGEIATLYRFTASGAAGLYTSVADMARFLKANAGLIDTAPLTMETVRTMREPHGSMFGVDIWGLGVMLLVPTASGDYVFGHGGANSPAINTMAQLNPDNGDGLVVFTSGHTSLASEIAFHWTFWQTGLPDFIGIQSEMERALPWYLGGLVIILLLAAVLAYRQRRSLPA